MSNKIAVAIIHGIGKQPADFSKELIHELERRCQPVCGKDVVIRPVYWAPVLQSAETRLWKHLVKGGTMRWQTERQLMIDFFADAIAYQITDTDRRAYDGVHRVFAKTLKRLARLAGADAPLCIIAHSLGSVIASNFIYDLQLDPKKHLIAEEVRAVMGTSPLERGETLNTLYTMGSPIALWSLRFSAFGKPIQIPDPRLKRHFDVLPTEWINFYDADDVVGYPLKTLNQAYGEVVTEDREVNVGSLLTSWNPASHLGYWKDKNVLDPIAKTLIEVWRTVNPPAV